VLPVRTNPWPRVVVDCPLDGAEHSRNLLPLVEQDGLDLDSQGRVGVGPVRRGLCRAIKPHDTPHSRGTAPGYLPGQASSTAQDHSSLPLRTTPHYRSGPWTPSRPRPSGRREVRERPANPRRDLRRPPRRPTACIHLPEHERDGGRRRRRRVGLANPGRARVAAAIARADRGDTLYAAWKDLVPQLRVADDARVELVDLLLDRIELPPHHLVYVLALLDALADLGADGSQRELAVEAGARLLAAGGDSDLGLGVVARLGGLTESQRRAALAATLARFNRGRPAQGEPARDVAGVARHLRECDRAALRAAAAGRRPGSPRTAAKLPVVTADERRDALDRASLYLICDASQVDRAPLAEIDVLQLRDKHASPADLLVAATTAARRCTDTGVLFIVNDHPQLARESLADGVHLGQDDTAPFVARMILGPAPLIGLSTHTPDQVDAADDVDYIGVGPIHPTPTKPGRPPVGLDLVRYAALHARVPFFAIGGIDPSNVADVRLAGATRIAVVRAIAAAPDPPAAARALREVPVAAADS
jgi:thiamine-phosphate pyrophosphorylase